MSVTARWLFMVSCQWGQRTGCPARLCPFISVPTCRALFLPLLLFLCFASLVSCLPASLKHYRHDSNETAGLRKTILPLLLKDRRIKVKKKLIHVVLFQSEPCRVCSVTSVTDTALPHLFMCATYGLAMRFIVATPIV